MALFHKRKQKQRMIKAFLKTKIKTSKNDWRSTSFSIKISLPPFRSRSRSRSPIFRRNLEHPPPRQRRWGRRLLTPGFRQGYFYRGGRGYAYPLWFYNGSYYPWWYAYYLGLMTPALYNTYSKKYGPPPPADLLDGRRALPVIVNSESISCDVCGATADEKQLRHCEGCKDAIYCGIECQRVDFKMHKEECL
jgi:hypothetical protein